MELKYAEADGRYYGSGRVTFDILTAPLTLIADWEPAGRAVRVLLPPASRRADIMALRKVEAAVQSKTSGMPTVTDAADWPLLLEYLTAEAYPDGQKRQTSSLIVVSDGSSWRVCLSDKDNARTMWKAGPTIQDALQAIELALMADDPGDWRRSAEATTKRRK